MGTPRYPDIQVRLRSRNPYALIAAVRQGLRRAGVARRQVEIFSQEALDCAGQDRLQEICGQWVTVPRELSST